VEAVRIAEVAHELGVSSDWLRRLERAGEIPKAQRDVNNHRRYAPSDLVRLREALFGQQGSEPTAGADGAP